MYIKYPHQGLAYRDAQCLGAVTVSTLPASSGPRSARIPLTCTVLDGDIRTNGTTVILLL